MVGFLLGFFGVFIVHIILGMFAIQYMCEDMQQDCEGTDAIWGTVLWPIILTIWLAGEKKLFTYKYTRED